LHYDPDILSDLNPKAVSFILYLKFSIHYIGYRDACKIATNPFAKPFP